MNIRTVKFRTLALSVALAAVGALGVLGARGSFADDPAPLTEAQQARVKTLIENLGSDDFRVREAATKELIEIGPRARAALEKARDSDVPEVRFRADQVLRRLDGKNMERPLEGGKTPDDGKPDPDLFDGWPGHNAEFERMVREFQKQAEDFRTRFGTGNAWAGSWPGVGGFFGRPARRHFTADGVDLRLQPPGVRLSVTEKAGDEVAVTHVYEAKTLDAILQARPELRDHKGVASVIEQRKKAEEEAAARKNAPARSFTTPFTFHSTTQGVQIESSLGRVRVTITENGPDGKPVTKTYEGTDLETLKKEHPELAEKLGGLSFRFEVGGGVPRMPGPGADPRGERPFRFDDPTFGGVVEPMTGPFGLGLRAGADGKSVGIAAVRAGSDAAKMGLLKGDVIVSINGTAVTLEGATSARELIRGAKDGAMTVEVLRDGKPVTLKR